jgi:hypothetical protein
VPKKARQPKVSLKPDLDERVAIPLDPEEAVKALLKVDPESEPVEGEDDDRAGS